MLLAEPQRLDAVDRLVALDDTPDALVAQVERAEDRVRERAPGVGPRRVRCAGAACSGSSIGSSSGSTRSCVFPPVP